jgi:antirestriction protein ArdC
MNAKSQMNAVSGSVFHGQNELSCLEAVKEHGYKSNLWVTYFQASELGLTSETGLRGKAVGLIRFAKDAKTGKSSPKWYNVFNLDLFSNVPADLTKTKPVVAKATKKATKKFAKKATKPSLKVVDNKAVTKVTSEVSIKPAIPVAGEPGFYLIANEKGIYSKHQIG